MKARGTGFILATLLLMSRVHQISTRPPPLRERERESESTNRHKYQVDPDPNRKWLEIQGRASEHYQAVV